MELKPIYDNYCDNDTLKGREYNTKVKMKGCADFINPYVEVIKNAKTHVQLWIVEKDLTK